LQEQRFSLAVDKQHDKTKCADAPHSDDLEGYILKFVLPKQNAPVGGKRGQISVERLGKLPLPRWRVGPVAVLAKQRIGTGGMK